MSKLLKSKFLLGVTLVAALMFVGATFASAAGGSITQTLRKGMKNVQVQYLQQTMNEKGFTVAPAGEAGSVGNETTYFGPATFAAVKAFQAANSLVVDGIFGPQSRGALGVTVGTNLPEGCTSTAGFSPTTGVKCDSGGSISPVTYPDGCTSAVGYSSTTGIKCDSTATPPATGPVTVALSSSTPASKYIINSQATADLADFTFTGNGTVTSVTLNRSGISNQNTLSNVYLYDGNTRLTDGYSFNTASQIVINNLNLVVNGSKTISVKADVSSTAAADSTTIIVTLTGFTSGTTASTVSLAGNLMYVAVGSQATVSFSGANTGAGGPGGTATVNAGTNNYTVWSAPIQINSTTGDILFKGMNVRVTGSAPADALSNVKLYVDGVVVGSPATFGVINGSNYAIFDFSASPVSLSTGTHTIDIRGDVEKGSSFTVQYSMQNAADMVLYDSQVGVNIAITAGSGAVPSTAGTITINAGSGTVVLDPAFQAFTNITGGSSNVDIAKFKVHGYGEDIKVQSLSITPILGSMTPAAAGLQNVTLYFNGSQVGSQTASWTSGAITFTLGSQMIVPAGTDSTLEVRADLRDTSGNNYTAGSVSATINLVASNAQGQTSKTSISLPSAPVTGNTLTVQTGLLAVSKNTGYANQTATPNTSDVKIGSFVLQNQSSSESVRVTSFAVDLTTDGSTALTSSTSPKLSNFSALKTSETSGSGSTPVQPSATNTFSVDFTLAPGATKTIDIFAGTSTANSGAVVATLVVTSIGVSSNVSVSQNGTGTAVVGQTITLSTGSVAAPTLLTASATSAQYIASGTGGSIDGTKASFNFVSTGGASVISELKFAVSRGTGSVTSVKVGNLTAPVVSGIAYLTGLNLTVPNGGSGLPVDVYVSYPEVGTNGIASATNSQVSLSYVKYTSGGTTTTNTYTAYKDVAGTGLVANTDIRLFPQDSYAVGTVVYTGANLAGGTFVLSSYPSNISDVTTTFSQSASAATWASSGWTVTGSSNTGFTATNNTNGSVITVSGMTAATAWAATVAIPVTATTGGYAVNSTVTTGDSDIGLATSGSSPAAPTMVLVGSKPTLAVTTTSNSGLNLGAENKIGEITVSADAKGNIKINDIAFTVASSGFTTVPTFTAARIADGTTTVTGSSCGQGTAAAASQTIFCEFGTAGNTFATTTTNSNTESNTDFDGYTIQAGTSKTFSLYATVTAANTGTNLATISSSLSASSFNWDDTSTPVFIADGTSVTTGTTAVNLTGSSIYNFPTGSYTIHQ